MHKKFIRKVYIILTILSLFSNQNTKIQPEQQEYTQPQQTSYWSLPNYNTETQTYEKSKKEQNYYNNLETNFNNMYQQPPEQQQQNLDINSIIKILTNVISSLKSQQKKLAQKQTSSPNDSISNLTRT